MNITKKMARVAGILYLVIIICAGFSQGYVRSSLIMPDSAAATAANIAASEGLFRIGFVSDLIAFMSDLIVAALFYILLKPVNQTLALAAAWLRLLAHPAIATVNLLNHFVALKLLNGADYLAVFSADQLHALVLLFLNMHMIGYLIAGAFFGVHLLLLGYLLFKSDLFPGILGVLIAVAAAGYLIESFGNFLYPEHKAAYALIVAIPAVIGEVTLTLWLLIKGVKSRPSVSMA
ncbi:DUF4386 domain-containing protein [candidate division KSB1 bacterium]|nr:DUF4386 domain-containing protein [candidate division KSB1 bacterium]